MFKLSKCNRVLPFAALLAASAGCSSGYRAEPYELPSSAIEAAAEDASSDPLFKSARSIPEDWWILFNDDQLADFILKAFAMNPTLQIAQTKILQAAYNAELARAPLFPNLNFGADVASEKFSQTWLIPGPPTGLTGEKAALASIIPAFPIYFTQYTSNLQLTYDFDIWGKNRNTLRAAIGQVYANMADEIFSRLQLGISVAQAYYQLQIDYKRQEINQALVENQEKYLRLLNQRENTSLENKSPVLSTQANLSAAKQRLLQIQGDIAVKENQLRAYLADNFEEEINTIEIADQPLPQVPLPRDLPLHLIAYRPDITAQLWLIESAGKQIEVAKAGFYPDLNLSALWGFQTIHLSKLFNFPSSTYYNVDPALTLPIFTGGRLMANLRGSEVNYDLAILQYNEMVLNAVHEVLDGLAVLRNSEQQLQEYKSQLDQQESLFKLTALRVSNNSNSGLDYLVSEQNMLTARDQELIALGNTIQAVLLMIRALGGGYDACY